MTESLQRAASRRRVIVVDDEKVIANTLAIILNNAGFEAKAAFCGEEAVILTESFRPDLLIADVIMPGMSGIEVAIVVREKLPNCKILLFSGQAATSDMLDTARSQGYDFQILAKPVHPADLLETLRVSGNSPVIDA
jgi:DNA-binding response OmpR family regulator